MKKVVKRLKLVLLIGMITVPTFLMARDPEDGGTPPYPGGTDPGGPGQTTDAPFDGGVSLLVAAGIGYGLKKVYEKKEAEKDSVIV